MAASYIYSTADVFIPSGEWTGYELHVSKTGEVVKAALSPYSKEKGGYYDVQKKQLGQEGFEELVHIVFKALKRYNAQQIHNLQNNHPDLYETLNAKS